MDVHVAGYYPTGTIEADVADVICAELRGQQATVECNADHDAVTVVVPAAGVREGMWVGAIAITSAVGRALHVGRNRSIAEPHRIEAARADAAA